MLDFPVENRLVIDEEPFLLPLLEHWHGEPSYLVALIDAKHAHVYEAKHGSSLDEVQDIDRAGVRMALQNEKPRFGYKKRFDQMLGDHAHGDEEAQYLKGVAQALGEHWAQGEFHGLILIARSSIRDSMRQFLPKDLAEILIDVDPHTKVASPVDVSAEVARAVEAWHAGRDAEITHELTQRRKEGNLPAQGPTDVLDALQQGRAASLIVGRSRAIPGSACRACGDSFGAPGETCVYCGGPCRSTSALQDILRRAPRQRLPVHLFRPDPDPVAQDGGVAALLRAGANWAPGTVAAAGPERTAHAGD